MDDEKRRKRQPRISGRVTTQRETDGNKNDAKDRHRSCPTAIERDGRDGQKAENVGLHRQAERAEERDLKHHRIKRAAEAPVEESRPQRNVQRAEHNANDG